MHPVTRQTVFIIEPHPVPAGAVEQKKLYNLKVEQSFSGEQLSEKES